MPRSPRWERAKADWSGYQWRDLFLAIAALIVAVTVLMLAGFGGSDVEAALIVGGAAITVGVVYPPVVLGCLWLTAPRKLLSYESGRLAERLDALEAKVTADLGEHEGRLAALERAPKVEPKPTEPPLDKHLTLLNIVRLGKQAWQTPGTRSSRAWAEEVVKTMNRMGMKDDLALFLAEEEMGKQLSLMERIAEKYKNS